MKTIFKIDSVNLDSTLIEILDHELGFDNDGKTLTIPVRFESMQFFTELFKRLRIKFECNFTNDI